MNTSKKNFGLTISLLGAGAMLWSIPSVASADVVYDTTTGGTQYIDQQIGNNYYYIGDTATIVPTTQTLTTIKIPFGTTYYDASGTSGAAFTYTPNITLDLYPSLADAETGTALIGSATVNNVTLSNDGVIAPGETYNYEDETLLNFDFTSQNITLPTTFAFAYHDAGSLDSNGTVNGENGLSVGLTTNGASTGVASPGYFDLYPNSAPSLTNPLILDPPPGSVAANAGINVEAQVNVVPEPTTLSLLGVGSLALLRRRRSSSQV